MTTPPFRHIAVLDIGKTNAKLVVVEAVTGREIAVAKTPNVVLRDGPYPHYDTDALWAFALKAFGDFVQKPGFDAISITTHGAAAALLDASGELALPVLDYEYEYPVEIRAAYDRLRPPFAESFSPRQAMGLNLGAQIHYQKTAFGDAFDRVTTILTYPQYWATRLTGVSANEVTSLGCHTDLWAPGRQRYSTLVEALGIEEVMAPVRSAFDALGPLKPEIAARLGLAQPVPVYCGIHDSNASLLPHLVAGEPPFSVVSTGTWVVAFGVGGDLSRLDPARDTLANVDAFDRPVPSARFMGGREFELLSAEIGDVSADSIERALPAVLSEGLMLLPNVAAGSGPFPGLERRWINAGNATAPQRAAAVCLYLALMTQTCLDLVGAGGVTVVEGPFATNRLYARALSALTDRPVAVAAGATGTSQGAALLTGIRLDRPVLTPIEAEIAGLSVYADRWRTLVGDAAGRLRR